jgi:hypothetical protein
MHLHPQIQIPNAFPGTGIILTMFCQKSPTFGYSYSTRIILTTICQKSPTFGYSYITRNILTTICQKSPSFGYSYSTRNHEGARHCRKPLGWRSVTKGSISSEKYWHYFNCPKNVQSSILSFIFWIFGQSNAAVVTSSKNLYIGPLVTLRRPRGFRQCQAPSWLALDHCTVINSVRPLYGGKIQMFCFVTWIFWVLRFLDQKNPLLCFLNFPKFEYSFLFTVSYIPILSYVHNMFLACVFGYWLIKHVIYLQLRQK